VQLLSRTSDCAFRGTNNAQLFKIRFSTLLDVLMWKTLNLNDHDRIVSNGYIDPFAYNMLGYSSADYSGDGGDELMCIFSKTDQGDLVQGSELLRRGLEGSELIVEEEEKRKRQCASSFNAMRFAETPKPKVGPEVLERGY